MPFAYIFEEAWRWFAETGINIVLLVLLALLVPRAGRFANRFLARRVKSVADPNEGKTQLAISGVIVYIAQLTAYFLIFIFLLQQLGFSLAGAAIPATVVSAAIGFGAQNIIADFLAGFFILTEKQYGVGDYVVFQGGGVDVEGEVIQITMRSTTIRTLNQSTVTIPNSSAKIHINQSNYWVNAVVVMPVPLVGSESTDHAIARSEQAARRALKRSDIRGKTMGDLQVHPAVAVNTPTAAGLPWTVDMRFLVRVEPLSQWMVERAIRVAILDEFWREYGSTKELFSLVDATSSTPGGTDPHHLSADAPTELIAKAAPASGDAHAAADAGAAQATAAFPATAEQPSTHQGDQASGQAGAPTAEQTKLDVDTSSGPVQVNGSDPAVADNADDDADDDDSADDNANGTRVVMGGLMRASTFGLILAFLVALIVRGLTLSPGDDHPANAGVLAPPARSTATSTTAPTSATRTAEETPTEAPSSTAPAATDETDATQPPTSAAAPSATGATGSASLSATRTSAPGPAASTAQSPAASEPSQAGATGGRGGANSPARATDGAPALPGGGL